MEKRYGLGAGMISYMSYVGSLKNYLSFGIPEFEGLFHWSNFENFLAIQSKEDIKNDTGRSV